MLVGPRYDGESTELAVNLSVVKKTRGRMIFGYIHESEVSHGRPFNDELEQTSDMVAVGWRWDGR